MGWMSADGRRTFVHQWKNRRYLTNSKNWSSRNNWNRGWRNLINFSERFLHGSTASSRRSDLRQTANVIPVRGRFIGEEVTG